MIAADTAAARVPKNRYWFAFDWTELGCSCFGWCFGHTEDEATAAAREHARKWSRATAAKIDTARVHLQPHGVESL